jgi:peroxiredoxin Q/BCP|tara:strand:- start:317 stop:571 length:255 start_codon:yes stop_codon:yes gene_type:complete
MKTALLILLVVWGIPSTFFRSRFRKIVYQTDDWKINIKPLFIKEIRGILSNIYPENKEYVRARNNYRAYLIVYLIIFVIYYFYK